jgi:hypothetical protein
MSADQTTKVLGSTSNFNPANITTSNVVLITLLVDRNDYMRFHKKELEEILVRLIDYFKGSHIKNRILLQSMLFNDKIGYIGYQPIDKVKNITITPWGKSAIYDSTQFALSNLVEYRDKLISKNISVESIVLLVSEGEDDCSSIKPPEMKQVIDRFQSNGAFTIMGLGVGKHEYEKTFLGMGIKKEYIANVETDLEYALKMINYNLCKSIKWEDSLLYKDLLIEKLKVKHKGLTDGIAFVERNLGKEFENENLAPILVSAKLGYESLKREAAELQEEINKLVNA